MVLISIIFTTALWVETTQADFADGVYERNLYASHRDGGSVEFADRFDVNNDGFADIPGDRWIMLGSSQGYSPDKTISGFIGEGGCDVADLDSDGYPDYVTNQVKGDGIRIFWGSADGPDPDSFYRIPVSNVNNEGVFTADFDKDGNLDILGSINDENAAVFWGRSPTYSDITLLPCHKMGYNPEAADLNQDGWLDAVVVSGDTENEYIYWGSPEGFSALDRTEVLYSPEAGFHSPHGMTIADLNYDGWLDLVFSPHWGPMEAAFLWGSSEVYSQDQYVLESFLPLPTATVGVMEAAPLLILMKTATWISSSSATITSPTAYSGVTLTASQERTIQTSIPKHTLQ